MVTRIRETVKERYAQKAIDQSSCCGSSGDQFFEAQAKRIGYSDEELQSAPQGANLGLGCGNPLTFENIKPGDTVLDLGSGAGFDCFLASKEVGPKGQVIGVDMTPEMIAKAYENKEKVGATNIEFRLGTIEKLPVDSDSVDLVISNCVINLSPDKPQVFREAFRVLKPGGVLAVSDIVLLRKLPWFIRRNIDAYVGCVAGAALIDDYFAYITQAGFKNVELKQKRSVKDIFPESDPTIQALIRYIPLPKKMIKNLSGRYAASIQVRASKPIPETTHSPQNHQNKSKLEPLIA